MGENFSESAFAGRKSGFKCFGCGWFGHKRADCPECLEKGREKNQKPTGKFNRRQKCGANITTENEMVFVAATGDHAFSTPAVIPEQKMKWFLDSGATDHMFKEKSFFEELHPLKRMVHITVAKSGQLFVALSAGTVRINMLIDGKKHPSVINEVLYVPDLQCNLFSVRRLEDSGMTVKIAGGKVSIEKDNRVVCVGQRKGQLYALDISLRKAARIVEASAMS